ncbi:protein of unknown function [Azospirillum baldaniorum]|uniref:Uncharacterized protein n=1 Tax=Azospirillum baldaniorum TaxID=1064539 RepID=A0A9P1JSV7_9PROT|nr:protein of unknown function [Azospirillum baldaniorum]
MPVRYYLKCADADRRFVPAIFMAMDISILSISYLTVSVQRDGQWRCILKHVVND